MGGAQCAMWMTVGGLLDRFFLRDTWQPLCICRCGGGRYLAQAADAAALGFFELLPGRR